MILDQYDELFIHNEWYDKYKDLIESNKDQVHIKFKTQKHHIIPNCYFKRNHLPTNNSKENKICLYFKDHILAHVYLTYCMRDANLRGCNLLAVNKLLGMTESKWVDNNSIEDYDLNLIQKCYEENKRYVGSLRKGRVSPNKGKHLTEETKELLRKANLGKKYSEDVCRKRSQSKMGHLTSKETRLKISKALKGRSRKPLSEEHKMKISNSLKGNRQTQDTKDKIGNSNRGRIQICKDGVIKCIYPKEFQYYESLGFHRGRK